MSEQIIYQHLMDRREGRGRIAAPPTAPACLEPTSPVKGRDHVQANKEAILWEPPASSIASRMPPAKSKGFCRGGMVNQDSNRVIVYESALERDFACILAADRRIVHIHDQPPAVEYSTPDGRWHRHTFDFLATQENGTRVAFAVKPSAHVERSGIRGILAIIQDQCPSFAHRFRLITEHQATKPRAFNARLILRSRRGRNEADLQAVRKIARVVYGAISIRDLVARTSLGARGWNAVICLIDEGDLTPADHGRLDERTIVRPTTHTIN